MNNLFLHNYIITKMSKFFVPSVTISLIDGNKFILREAYGFSDLENSKKAIPETIYEIASITKTFTATAIMQLVEKGKISLDDPAEKYLPISLRVKGEPVRIWHLLSHTSGIAALGYAEAQITSYLGQGPTWLAFSDPLHVLKWLEHGSKSWAVAPPGERFFYLNEGFVALGYIIEKVAGVPYSQYIHKNIIEPLNLSQTRASFEEVKDDPFLAKPYDNTKKPPKESRIPSTIYADGGMYSSSPDLSRFMLMLAKRGSLNGIEILSPSSVKEMEKSRVKLPMQLFGNDSYGLGLIIYDNFFDDKLIGHSGSVLVYTGYAGYLSSKNMSVSVLANANFVPRDVAMVALALKTGNSPEELPFMKSERILKLLEGVYFGYQGTLKVKIESLGDYLIMKFIEPPGESIILEPDFEYSSINIKSISKIDFKTRINGRKLTINVFIDQLKGVVDIIYERYKLTKVAPLESVEGSLSSIDLY